MDGRRQQDTDRGKFLVEKLPGRPKAGEVTLTRGLTHDSSFSDRIRDSQFGKVPDARMGGAIIVFDPEALPCACRSVNRMKHGRTA
jgi:hypothetical protein